MSKGLRVPVLVDRESYDQFKAYSELTGVPMARLIRDAMQEYAEVTLAARTEALTSATATCTVRDDIDFGKVVGIDTFAMAAKA
jgi:hypothetical protein